MLWQIEETTWVRICPHVGTSQEIIEIVFRRKRTNFYTSHTKECWYMASYKKIPSDLNWNPSGDGWKWESQTAPSPKRRGRRWRGTFIRLLKSISESKTKETALRNELLFQICWDTALQNFKVIAERTHPRRVFWTQPHDPGACSPLTCTVTSPSKFNQAS